MIVHVCLLPNKVWFDLIWFDLIWFALIHYYGGRFIFIALIKQVTSNGNVPWRICNKYILEYSWLTYLKYN